MRLLGQHSIHLAIKFSNLLTLFLSLFSLFLLILYSKIIPPFRSLWSLSQAPLFTHCGLYFFDPFLLRSLFIIQSYIYHEEEF